MSQSNKNDFWIWIFSFITAAIIVIGGWFAMLFTKEKIKEIKEKRDLKQRINEYKEDIDKFNKEFLEFAIERGFDITEDNSITYKERITVWSYSPALVALFIERAREDRIKGFELMLDTIKNNPNKVKL